MLSLMVSFTIILPVRDQLADQLTASLLAPNCGDYCENHTFDFDTVLFTGGQHLWLHESDCNRLLCCYPLRIQDTTDSWVRCLLPAWAGSTRLLVNTNVLSTVRLFELTEQRYVWKFSHSKMVFAGVKYLNY